MLLINHSPVFNEMLSSTRKTVSQIKSLRIQGAEAIADAALNALANEAKKHPASSPAKLLSHLHSVSIELSKARPTEPALRNVLRFVLTRAKAFKTNSALELGSFVSLEVQHYEKKAIENRKLIAEHGSRLVPRRGAVLIHCHSSTVMQVLKRAHDQKKKFRVYCCESRPRYQGRVSAKELSDYGLDVTLVVDNAVSSVFQENKELSAVFVGADAITARGELVNKVGTAGIALQAREYGKKFYACTGLHKFDALTLSGAKEPIEYRSVEEVLPKAEARKMPKVKVLNPAFDLTPARFITAFVTEAGVVSPGALLPAVWREYGLDLKRG
ncbi:MAG: S-methyl-5-thioribose-1-phosphate isomerase [Candidatus Micrarchaeota archaeon]